MSKNLRSFLAITALAVVAMSSAGSARAESITSLYSTGTNSSDTAASPGTTTDLHYTIISAPSGVTAPASAVIFSSLPAPYYADTSSSQWIGVTADGTATQPTGMYEYQTTFTIAAGLNLSTAVITGEIGADNSVTIKLNGNTEFSSVSGGISSPNAFTINSNFLAGTNTLDFIVNNGTFETGLNVLMTGTISPSVVPEPSSVVLCGLAGLISSAYAWRRRKARRTD
jgi:PEP-CTERM motif